MSAVAKFSLMTLPYEADELEPYISAETINYHHGKHLAGYVAKTNSLIDGTPYANMTLEEIILKAEGALFNNAAQVWNHEFYFSELAPANKCQHQPKGLLLKAIEEQFGSVEKLKEKLTEASISLFGSGWVWLVSDDKYNLQIITTPNAKNPLTKGLFPLLAIDVWEHAYYIDYRNSRADAIKAFWNVLDWRIIDKRFDAIHKSK